MLGIVLDYFFDVLFLQPVFEIVRRKAWGRAIGISDDGISESDKCNVGECRKNEDVSAWYETSFGGTEIYGREKGFFGISEISECYGRIFWEAEWDCIVRKYGSR